jgi:hypothetical protein
LVSLIITVPPVGMPVKASPTAVVLVPMGKVTSKICSRLVPSPTKVTIDPLLVTVPVCPVRLGSLMHWEMAVSWAGTSA